MENRKFLLKRDELDERDYLFADNFDTNVKLPQSVDLRPKLPPIWNQENLGSCQSHAIDAIVSYLHNNDFDPSRLFTYYNVRSVMGEEYINQDCGGTLSDTCKAVAKYGVCPTSDCPYDITKFTDKPSDKSYADATKDEIYTYHRIKSVNEAKQALAQNHLVLIGLELSENFESDECINTGVVPTPHGQIIGGHALVLCCFEDNIPHPSKLELFIDKITRKPTPSKGNFIFRNSWGLGNGLPDEKTGIGTGYYQISYENFEKMVMDMWVIVK